MTSPQLIARWSVLTGLVVVVSAAAAGAQDRGIDQEAAARQDAYRARLDQLVETLAQTRGQAVALRPQGPNLNVAGSDPMGGPVVRNAPYSGDALTTVTQTLGDGTRIEQSTTARFSRDSAGRVRREQQIMGLAWLNGSSDTRTVITVDPDPGDGSAYQLDVNARTAARTVASPLLTLYLNIPGLSARRGGAGVRPQDNRTAEQSLGTRQIEGVQATGRKTTTTIPPGEIGNDRPIEITEERWESPELQVLLYSRHSDPRTGVVEYRLTNINRAEPPLDLFTVPADYTILGGGRGQRTGGAGGRGR